MPERNNFVFVSLDDREAIINDLSDTISTRMGQNNLPLPPAWPSVRELAEFVFHVNDPAQTSLSHIIGLRNELMRTDYINGCIWQEFVDEYHLIAPSPLDQFTILPLIPMELGDLYFSFTNLSFFMLLTLSLVLLFFYFVTKKGGGNLVPNAWQSLVELIYDFVLNLVNEQIGGLSGNVKQKFFPCILVTFTFLLFCNLQGMIPYSFTVTSHFLITLGLSFSIFIGITIVGFQRNGLHFLSFLLPAGVPLPLAPFLVLLELISYCFRALSLGIRLFANMMAGHSLVKILSGFAWTMLCMNDLFYFIGDLGPLFIVLALTGLELGVAILQAYVFTILICIYLNDAINLH
jgi:F-type H+-transporting ATPase subunit a